MKGGGTMVSFEIDGGKSGAFRFANASPAHPISNNLGDAKSIGHSPRHDNAPAPHA